MLARIFSVSSRRIKGFFARQGVLSPLIFNKNALFNALNGVPSRIFQHRSLARQSRRVNKPKFTNVSKHQGFSVPVESTTPKSTRNFLHLLSQTTLTVTINNRKLPFPLPDGNVSANVEWAGQIRAPFLNREAVLISILESVYANWSGSPKPIYNIVQMGRGSGKSRLLTEWVYQALSKPEVIEPFVAAGRPDRKKFINMLYEAAFTQRWIIQKGGELDFPLYNAKFSTAPVEDMIRKNIEQRFGNKTIDYNGETIQIKRGFHMNLPGLDLNGYIDLLNSLIDKYCTQVTQDKLPYPEEGFGKPILLFGLDECQDYSAKDPLAEGKEDPVYCLLRASGYVQERISTPFHWLVVGTAVAGQYEKLEDLTTFLLQKVGMENLLQRKHLERIVLDYFNKKLLHSLKDTEGNSEYLHPSIAAVLYRYFVLSVGIPRALEILINVSYTPIMHELKHLKESKLEWNSMFASASPYLDLIGAEFNKQITLHYPPTLPYALHKVDRDAVELLDLKAALCLPLDTHTPLPVFNLSPQTLEQYGYLVTWKYLSETAKCYTRPFFMAYEDIKPIEIFQQAPERDFWKPLRVTIGSLILHPFIAATLRNGNIKGASLEYTTASALYTRYTIQKHSKEGPVLLKDILPVSEDWPEVLKTAEINWKGLAVLKVPASAETLDVLKQITDDQVITIDTMSSEFADVIVPITTSTGQAKFLGIQTKHGADHNLFAKNALEVLKHPDFFFVTVSLKELSLETINAQIVEMGVEKELKAVATRMGMQKQERPKKISIELQNLAKLLENPAQFTEKLIEVLVAQPQIIQDLEKLREDRTLYIPAKQIVSPRWLTYFEMNLDFDDSEVNEPSNSNASL